MTSKVAMYASITLLYLLYILSLNTLISLILSKNLSCNSLLISKSCFTFSSDSVNSLVNFDTFKTIRSSLTKNTASLSVAFAMPICLGKNKWADPFLPKSCIGPTKPLWSGK